VTAVKDFLFLDPTGDSFDLPALNIHRGRDHGIPSYTSVRRGLGLRCPTSFNDLQGLMTSDTIHKLTQAYRYD